MRLKWIDFDSLQWLEIVGYVCDLTVHGTEPLHGQCTDLSAHSALFIHAALKIVHILVAWEGIQ